MARVHLCFICGSLQVMLCTTVSPDTVRKLQRVRTLFEFPNSEVVDFGNTTYRKRNVLFYLVIDPSGFE